jgi:hypothetical protein
VAISETSASSKETTPRFGVADKLVSDACFNDWKRFCFVLREIASGENGRPLSGLEAQKRAQAVLTECGYAWPSRAPVYEPIVAATAAVECLNTKTLVDPQRSPAGVSMRGGGKARPSPGRPRSEHRVSALAGSGRA